MPAVTNTSRIEYLQNQIPVESNTCKTEYLLKECAGFGAQKFGARDFEPTIWCLRFSAQKRDLVPGRFSAWEILCLKYDLVPGRFSAQRFGDWEI